MRFPSLRWAAIFVLACLASASYADWRDHTELPDWARRGFVQWGHGANIDGRIKWTPGGFGVDMPNAKLLLYCGRNIEQTIGYLDPDIERLARAGGLRRQPYICSQTVWWRTEYPKWPGLDKATCLNLDGTHAIMAYGNPERHAGCYNNPGWLEYMKKRVRDTISGSGGKVDSIFFDNPLPTPCYCTYCQDKFRRFTRETLGEEMDLTRPKDFPNYLYAKRLFECQSLLDFFRQVKAYIATFDPTITISPNLGVGGAQSVWLTTHGMTDMVFCENGNTFPPFDSTVIDYKLGLAASHGLATGQLLGLSETMRRTRALAYDASNEAGILESFVYPQEHELAYAEALACDGSYIASFALRELKITVSDRPDQVGVRDTLHRYSEFQKAHASLYDRALPAAKVAVLHATLSRMASGSWSWPLFTGACQALGRAGIPYEVIIEEDLTPEQIAGYRVLFVPQARLLDPKDISVVEQYVRGGGSVVILGDIALCDRLNHPYALAALSALAKLPTGTPAPFGRGHVWRPQEDMLKVASQDMVNALQGLAGPLPCRVTTASGKLFANLLRSHNGRTLSVHLVNSDFRYDEPPTVDLRDDDGAPEARAWTGDLKWRLRKTLVVPDLAAVNGWNLKFLGQACGVATDNFSLAVALNGQDIVTIPGSKLREGKWYEAAIPAGLLHQGANEVVFRGIGKPNGHPDYFQLRIDTDAKTGRSAYSMDEGHIWSTTDLSLDPGEQPGEYMVRLGPHVDPERVSKPEDFYGKLHVQPAKGIEVRLSYPPAPLPPREGGKATEVGAVPPPPSEGGGQGGRKATLLLPDGSERPILPTRQDGYAVYRLPEVPIYAVLVLPQP